MVLDTLRSVNSVLPSRFLGTGKKVLWGTTRTSTRSDRSDMCGATARGRVASDMSDEDAAAAECVGDAWCVVTYGGSRRDALLNYAVLALQLAVNLKFFLASRNSKAAAAVHFAILLLVIAYQIGLCVLIGCSGVRDG